MGNLWWKKKYYILYNVSADRISKKEVRSRVQFGEHVSTIVASNLSSMSPKQVSRLSKKKVHTMFEEIFPDDEYLREEHFIHRIFQKADLRRLSRQRRSPGTVKALENWYISCAAGRKSRGVTFDLPPRIL